MTTGATIHTTEGLKMTVTRRMRPPLIPVLEDPTVNMIDESSLIKSYKGSNGVAVQNPEIYEDKVSKSEINRNEIPSSYP